MTDATGAARVLAVRGGRVTEDAVDCAVAAFAHALRLSCLAAQHPAASTLANEAVSAHVAARAWAEEAVRRAGRSRA